MTIERRKGIGWSEFRDACSTHRGAASKHHCQLMRHKGIFIGFHDWDWVIFASSDPGAKWINGDQNMLADGNCLPYSPDGARLLEIKELPKEAQPLAEKWVQEAIEIARQKIADYHKRVREEQERKRKQLEEEEYNRTVRDPWLRALEENGEP